MNQERDKALTEVMGLCWHGFSHNNAVGMVCFCGEYLSKCKASNPSLTNLNELFRLAIKLKPNMKMVLDFSDNTNASFTPITNSLAFAEALLDALYQAVKEK